MRPNNLNDCYLIRYLLKKLKYHHYTSFLHSVRVARLTKLVSEELELSQEEKILNCKSALLHDIGKFIVPKDILNKPGKLTELEYDIIKIHPLYGNEILKFFPSLKDLIPGMLYHHERLDGSGYPFGLNDFPLVAQIIGVCDSFDAMTTERPYNKGKIKNEQEAILELKNLPRKYNIFVVLSLERAIKKRESGVKKGIS
ncbi:MULTISPECIES: HD-GYP domain-containing protein [Thermoanaerobacter]|uniref:Metal dependent phosphohydrolase n=2 Tax=Thermoanaerobacter TaxID=1754 RepID=B0KA68_THEP3|nr:MULTISPECIES: HD domain-containing phosphohydrolase [Thermoanaerobacter]ABY95031.1 metal dependent phosphohydrolase [Thermoanaerobacter pseudethanolicus ATCC 33223]ADV79981.1 metal-dependent phosphohydrolase HD sub domain protein [Thermoanaerobacter brockii subsp. finnii Ako-1]HBW58926.1 HD domain-containing protein [Thermoanaerobacter sp.]